jgi:hypothetical protein
MTIVCSGCQNEITLRVKKMRQEAATRYERMGLEGPADYMHPGEMRGYFKVLELLSPNPLED